MAFLAPADRHQLDEIVEQTYSLWGEGLGRAGHARYNEAQRRSPWGLSHLQRLVLTDGRRWLSTAKRYDLRGRLDGEAVRILGIGAVFTPVPLRRQGHAADLLRRVLDQAQGEGFDLALLFSEIGLRYYETLGFERVPVSQLVLRVDPLRGPAAIPMRSGELRDAPAIADMNARQAAGFRFGLERDPEYIAYSITKKRLVVGSGGSARRRLQFFVVEEGGRAAAYAVILEVGDSWMVTECGDRDPSGARVGAMLQSLLGQAEAQPKRLRAWLPDNFLPPQVHVAAREVPTLAMMVRPIRRGLRIEPPLEAWDLAYWHADAF